MAEEGFPEDEIHEAARRLGGEGYRKPKQKLTLGKKDDIVQIDRYIDRYQDVFGGEEAAMLSMGGHGSEEHNNKPARIALISIWDQRDPRYMDLAARAGEAGHRPSDLLALALAPEGSNSGPTAFAFLETRAGYILGRQGTVRWMPYEASFVHDDPEWSPFQDNDSVSRRQLSLNVTENGMVINSLTDNSKTQVVSAGVKQANVVVEPA